MTLQELFQEIVKRGWTYSYWIAPNYGPLKLKWRIPKVYVYGGDELWTVYAQNQIEWENDWRYVLRATAS